VTDKRPCQATASHGAACRAWAPDGSDYCRVHDPSKAEEVQAGRIRGAKKAGQLRMLRGRRPRLDRPGAMTKFLATLMLDTLEGRVEADIARSVGYLANVQRAYIEQADLERRLEALEQQVAAAEPHGRRTWGS
jgi:hypothetical protein